MISKEIVEYLEATFPLIYPTKDTSMEEIQREGGVQDLIAHLKSLYERQIQEEY